MAGTLPVPALVVYPSITSFPIASPRTPLQFTSFKLPPNAPRLSCMASFKITLLTPSGEKIIDVPDDTTIAEAAEDQGIPIPLSCRSGACSSCAAVLKQGVVDQAFQSFLDEKQLEQGFVLTCVAYPLSDAVLQTHQESVLY